MAMPDVPESVRRRMSNTRGRDTKVELEVRQRLHAMGLRYRVNLAPVRDVRRTADIVFPRRRLVVMLDGCFWHRCPEHYVEPRSRVDFWRAKIDGNVARDRQTDLLLSGAGWEVMRFWEHEDPEVIASEIAARWSSLAAPRNPS